MTQPSVSSSDFIDSKFNDFVEFQKYTTPTNVRQYLGTQFPYSLWEAMQNRYRYLYYYSSGEFLNEKIKVDSDDNVAEELDAFPLKLNLFRTLGRRRGFTTVGEPRDLNGLISKALITPHPLFKDEYKEFAAKMQIVNNQVWMDNNGLVNQMQCLLDEQQEGGFCYRLRWDTSLTDRQLVPIELSLVPVQNVLPIGSKAEPFDLLEAYYITEISAFEALYRYNLDVDLSDTIKEYVYIEHWTRTHYTITINGEPIQYNGVVLDNVENPFGYVPYVYVPTIREAGSFFGTSIVDETYGVVKEYNTRMADGGDAVGETLNRQRWVKNIETNKVTERIVQGTNESFFDLGKGSYDGKQDPAIYFEDPPKFSDAHISHIKSVWLQALRESSLTAIAFGEDEGSQRSALTLAFRMWPVTAFTRMLRVNATNGFNQINRIIIKMLEVKWNTEALAEIKAKFGDKVPDRFLRYLVIMQDWSEQIPRDREQLTNEVTIRVGGKPTMSQQTGMALLGDIVDVEDEQNRIEEETKKQMELMMQSNPQAGGVGGAKPQDGPVSASEQLNATASQPVQLQQAVIQSETE